MICIFLILTMIVYHVKYNDNVNVYIIMVPAEWTFLLVYMHNM